jgi:hypothetical protein
MAYNQTAWRNEVENGRIPGDKLAQIVPTDYDADLGGPARMHPEAAWNYQRMCAAAREVGVYLSISYSYRTYAKQVEKYENYQHGGNLAAVPGTSNHGWATALDLGIPAYPAAHQSRAFQWLEDNAARYGFHNNDAPSEPWHWDYEGGHPIEEDPDMAAFADFKEGVKAAKDGKPVPNNASDDFKFGYNMETRAVSNPKPGAPGDHKHEPGGVMP